MQDTAAWESYKSVLDMTAIGPFSTYILGLLWAAISAYQAGQSTTKTFLTWFFSIFVYIIVSGQIKELTQAPVLKIYDQVAAYATLSE